VSELRPRLRGVEAFPVQHDGRRFVGLRDPSGYTASVLLLPVELTAIVRHFDGEHSIADIQAEVMRRQGELVAREAITGLAAMLDEHGFIDSEAFARRRHALEATYLAAPVRPAAHAGGAYAGEAEALRQAIDGYFAPPAGPGPIASAGTGERLTGVIAPHIDFHRGGPAYAWAYREVAERCDADLFVILGTCHGGMRDAFALTRKDYDTPLGPARVDQEFVDALAHRASRDWFGSEVAHRSEHSIEFQAVFLRYLLAGRREFTIAPILASFAHEALAAGRDPEADRDVARFLDALAETAAASSRRIAFIAGADLAHVGPRFGDPAPLAPTDFARVEHEDRVMLAAVVDGDARGFFASVAADGDRRRICGLSPIYTVLRVLGGKQGTLRHYGQTPDPDCVVTFASVVFP
jgi:AmmeMemoRadiSam system protein B